MKTRVIVTYGDGATMTVRNHDAVKQFLTMPKSQLCREVTGQVIKQFLPADISSDGITCLPVRVEFVYTWSKQWATNCSYPANNWP